VDWSPPTGVRCDHALRAGAEVPAWYDSMVAKLIAHAPTREQCIDQLAAAIDRTVLLGLQSNRAFLGRLLRHENFRAGLEVSTAFIEQQFGVAASRQPQPDVRVWALAAWLSVAQLEHQSTLAAALATALARTGGVGGRNHRDARASLPDTLQRAGGTRRGLDPGAGGAGCNRSSGHGQHRRRARRLSLRVVGHDALAAHVAGRLRLRLPTARYRALERGR
jgi:acetyl/propionyl-CoA carboxylase alpha subunit